MANDLFASIEPPREDVERLVGTISGNLDGLGAGLECWCGPLMGWRALGQVLGGGSAAVVRHRGRMVCAISFDLGEAPPMRQQPDEDEAGA